MPVNLEHFILRHIIVESLIVAVVGYCITLSMAKIYADKFGYKVDGNQEMFGEVRYNLLEILY